MNQQEKHFYQSIDTSLIKSQFGDVFLELREIIELHDPMRLTQYDVVGEYDPETASILIQLRKDLTQEEVHDLVYTDFSFWFEDVVGQKEDYNELSEAIYAWMMKTQLNSKF